MSNSGGKNRAFRLAGLGLLGVLISVMVFVWLAEAIQHQRTLPWDTAILKFLQGPATHGANTVMSLVARTGDINAVVVLAVIMVLVLKHRRGMRDALFVTLTIVGVVVINLLVRTTVQRPQLSWEGQFAPTFESGFPSSQAADTFAIAFVLAVLTWATRWRWLAVTLGGCYVFAVGLLRLRLGLHYPSDIVAGWALALAWAIIVSFVTLIPRGESTKLDSVA